MKKLVIVSDVMGNKSVIHDGVNGYVCDKPEDYARHIKDAMKSFPTALPEQAYQDVLNIYNTDAMKKKYIDFYGQLFRIWGGRNEVVIYYPFCEKARMAVA